MFGRGLVEMFAAVSAACLFAVVWLLARARSVRRAQADLADAMEAVLRGERGVRARPVLVGEVRRVAERVYELIEALQEEREITTQEQSKLGGIMSHILSGVIVIDRAGRVVLVNSATERMFGLTADDMVGRWHWEAGHHYGLASLVDEAIAFGVVQKREVQLHKPNELILEAHITPILQMNGAIAGAVVLLHDVTEWRRVEQMRTDFVANVSHELRTPITALKGFAETLLDGALSDPDTARQFVQIIKDEADRLGRLVQDLLDLSQIEARQSQLQLSEFAVEPLLQKVVETFSTQAADARVRLSYAAGGGEPCVVYADYDRLLQVLINLVSNALQFTQAGGEIILSAEAMDGRVQFSVQDSGVGIPPADIGRVFERFYRVDKTRSRQSGGTGLGLAIVKHIVEAHGGHVGVTSAVGHGSRFFFDVAAGVHSASEMSKT